MILRWDGDVALADEEMIAALYRVSRMSVRRHCTVVRRFPPAGPGSVQALYDVFTAEDELAKVAARPERTIAARRLREQADRRAAGGRSG